MVRRVISTMVVLDLLAALWVLDIRSGTADVLVGQPPPSVQQALPAPTIVTQGAPVQAAAAPTGDPEPIPPGDRVEPGPSPDLRRPDAAQYGPAAAFDEDGAPPPPDGLVFVLAIGSDARPGEPVDRARADSIHLLAVNPASGTGTVLGLPRDTWVEIPGHGRGKINSALPLGGPDLLAETVQRLTGLPVHWWLLTGFQGLERMVDELGRLVVPVHRRMADGASGAFFDRGFHDLAGHQVLAFTRDRHSVARGDFSRSENHGTVLLQALRKLRVETDGVGGLARWLEVLRRHVRIDAALDDAARLAATARRIDPDRVTNVVAPGGVGTAGGASVVFLGRDAAALFADLRDDATIGTAPPPTTTTTTTTTTSTTSTTIRPLLDP